MIDFNKALLLAVMLTAGAHASTNQYAFATAQETHVFLGQVFNLDVIVKSSDLPSRPDLDHISGFHVTEIDAGKATNEENTWHYRYALRATQEGDLTIPPLNYGQSESEPITIHASKPEISDRMTLSQTLSTNSVYAGEPVLLTTVWDSTYPFSALKSVDFHFPMLNDQRFTVLDPYTPEKEKQNNATGLPLHGTRILASRNTYDDAEIRHQTLRFEKILIPKKSGTITLPSSTLLCAADQTKDPSKHRRAAFQYPAYFDNTFFDQNVSGEHWARIYTESAPLLLDVKPLPKKNRPSLFDGMVGEFSMQVDAEPLDVRVGEPITLTIKITAEQYMENIFFPPLRYQPNLVNQFESPSDRSLPKLEEKTKIYTQTIRPRSTTSTEIPPLQLAFFSPKVGDYVVLESEPIPINVSPAEAIGVFGGTIHQNKLRPVSEGIRHNVEGPLLGKTRRIPLFGWAHPAAVLLILFLPPILFISVYLTSFFGENKYHIQRTAKAARAFKVFRKNAAHIRNRSMKSEIYEELDRVLRAYLGDRLHLNPGALSFNDAEQKLAEAGASAETLQNLKTLFALCEAYRFTTRYDEKGAASKIIHEAVNIVRSVERSLK